MGPAEDDKEGCGSAELGEQPRDAALKGINSAGPLSFTKEEIQKAVDLLDRWMDITEQRLKALETDMRAFKEYQKNMWVQSFSNLPPAKMGE